jgi:GT2 family glycosyltransferase
MDEAAVTLHLGIVVIGRNEGERLRQSLLSLPSGVPALYVDSGSSDGSVDLAESLGIAAITLSPNLPFTAARGRNSGFAEITKCHPEIEAVQMLDGDCELHKHWLEAAALTLEASPKLGIVFGRLHERNPEANIYLKMCQAEWNVPIGPAKACGGIALIRAEALRAVGGYADDLVAGEEPEMCLRLRNLGWEIEAMAHNMANHDAAIDRFGQWWQRAKRGGLATAAQVERHRSHSDPSWIGMLRRALLWGLALPLLFAFLLLAQQPISTFAAFIVLALYPAQWLRLTLRSWRGGASAHFAAQNAFFLVLGKFAEAQGIMTLLLIRLRKKRESLIEYK